VADQARKEQGMEVKAITKNHMLFVGNPGTGKTTMGRLVAMLLHKVGILPTNRFKEVQREDLVATHVGQTAPKTEAVVMDIKDGVLFIDEVSTAFRTEGFATTEMCRC
jgi:MoxR-like ATPase